LTPCLWPHARLCSPLSGARAPAPREVHITILESASQPTVGPGQRIEPDPVSLLLQPRTASPNPNADERVVHVAPRYQRRLRYVSHRVYRQPTSPNKQTYASAAFRRIDEIRQGSTIAVTNNGMAKSMTHTRYYRRAAMASRTSLIFNDHKFLVVSYANTADVLSTAASSGMSLPEDRILDRYRGKTYSAPRPPRADAQRPAGVFRCLVCTAETPDRPSQPTAAIRRLNDDTDSRQTVRSWIAQRSGIRSRAARADDCSAFALAPQTRR
jgi:hypothetical protein